MLNKFDLHKVNVKEIKKSKYANRLGSKVLLAYLCEEKTQKGFRFCQSMNSKHA